MRMISGVWFRLRGSPDDTVLFSGSFNTHRGLLGLYWGYMEDNGKENGNYYSILWYVII